MQRPPQPPKPEDKPLKSPKVKPKRVKNPPPPPQTPPNPQNPPNNPPNTQKIIENKPNQTIINQLQSKPLLNPLNPPKNEGKEGHANGLQPPEMNVEQFLSNLNINTTNLSQLISEKLSQELPNVDHKILNIQAGPNVGQLVAKIDISGGNSPQMQIIPPPETSQIKQENEIIGGMNEVPALVLQSENQTDKNTVYQRIQTIQLTPQKQQLLKNVQLQIQALTSRLQHPKDPKCEKDQDGEVQNALRHLYLEQQKILATGKLLPTINPLNCNMEVGSSQPAPTIPKTNGGNFMTSIQPVVSSNQNQKIYYHNGNQIISLNPPIVTSSASICAQAQPPTTIQPPQQPQTAPQTATTTTTVQTQTAIASQQKIKKATPPQTQSTPVPSTPLGGTPVKPPVTSTSDKGCQMSPVQIKTEVTPVVPLLLSPKSVRPAKPTYSKAQLIEQQLQTDQNGANNPDINSPFTSKADACKRLVRYHCYNQPVLSEKDLNKADEIFELTARHFIGKFQGMVNKYKYLLLKESMREVPTSELMMIDRMFLAEEQQSFLKLQSDLKLQNDLEQEEEEAADAPIDPPQEEDQIKAEFQLPEDLISDFVSVKQEGGYEEEEHKTTNTDFNIKCGLNYFAQDESCDSVVYATNDDDDDDDEEGEEASPQKDPKQENNAESYNTTKIIGNFEIEINNKGCNSQESYTKNFRQKIIENKTTDGEENFEKGDDYDEWLCIQRELGYLPPDSGKPENKEQEIKEEKTLKRSSNNHENRLETLKKFRVEKHNSKSKKTGSIIGEVKFEVRIEHKKVNSAPNPQKGQGGQKRTLYEFPANQEGHKKQRNTNPEIQIKQEDNNYLEENFPELLEAGQSPDGLIDTSIDEQVQSAIDSILNLQQIASMSMPEQKDPNSGVASSGVLGASTSQIPGNSVTCRNINTLTNIANNSREAADLFGVSEGPGGDGLDDAVKSILS